MSPHVLEPLRARVSEIRTRWETLLRLEPVSGPLANPDALALLIPETLQQLLGQFAPRPTRLHFTLAAAKSDRLPPCDCGNNPYLAYYVAGEQAVVEAVVLIQAELPAALRKESDLAEAIRAVRRLAHTEIDAFCGICVHHGIAPRCRHATAAR